MNSRELIKLFIENNWDKDYVYTAKYFSDTYGLTQHVARHHLEFFLHTGKLCCLKVKGRKYYMLPEQKQLFEKYNDIAGVYFV